MKYTLALFLLIPMVSLSQDFDRELEKNIKTEINLNRIAMSRNRLIPMDNYKAAADSLNKLVLKTYLESQFRNTRENYVNDERIWNIVHSDWKSKHQNDFSVSHAIVVDGDYKRALKNLVADRPAMYDRTESIFAVSAIRHGKEIIITVVSF